MGLVLVVVQIDQNSELVREQMYQARWSDRMNLYLAMMGENPAAALAKADEDPQSLTYEESRVITAYLRY